MTLIVGAYPLYQTAPDPTAIVAALAASEPVGGLEVPFLDGRIAIPPGAPADWEYVVTMIPVTMGRLGSDPRFGLASPDSDGRRAAVAGVRDLFDAVQYGTAGIRAVELQSAPTRTAGRDAFAESLAEITAWDWGSRTRVLVEHQDAWTDAHPVQKGFLSLADELDAAEAAGAGITINWARSVIESRDPATGLDHVRQAAARGLLAGVIFSSVSDRDNELGLAWADMHAAPAGTSAAPAGSLLDAASIAECVAAAGGAWIGYKVNLPGGASTDARIAALLETASLITGSQRGMASARAV